jgi:hypothetical protein
MSVHDEDYDDMDDDHDMEQDHEEEDQENRDPTPSQPSALTPTGTPIKTLPFSPSQVVQSGPLIDGWI